MKLAYAGPGPDCQEGHWVDNPQHVGAEAGIKDTSSKLLDVEAVCHRFAIEVLSFSQVIRLLKMFLFNQLATDAAPASLMRCLILYA